MGTKLIVIRAPATSGKLGLEGSLLQCLPVRVRLSARHKKKDDSGTSQSNLAEVVSASSPIHNTGANKTREPAVDVTTTTHAETL